MASTVLFYILALIIIIPAIMMVFSKNLVHSALFMVVSFAGVAGIYVQLSADFLAIAQILVYVGAIAVLMIFGIMLTKRNNIGESNIFNRHKAAGAVTAAALFVILTYFISSAQWRQHLISSGGGTTDKIADLLLNSYVVPFEVSGLLLLVALIGAIIIGKGEGNSK